ncbi:MAG: TlpA disulfide reductase family protein [Myxococcota bacterium]
MTDQRQRNAEILRRWARNIGPWIVVAGLVWYVGVSMQGRALPKGPAPELSVELSDGTPFNLASRHGEVTVLNFWAAWCPPCRAEAPALTKVHKAVEGRGAMVVGLAVDAISIPRARRLGMLYPQALVEQADLDRFQVQMLPTTVVVDHKGDIVRAFVGEVEEETLLEVVEEALAARPERVAER